MSYQDNPCILCVTPSRYENRFTLCPSMATPLLVQPETYCPEGQTHPRTSECNCGQIVTPRADNSHGIVPPTRGVQPPMSDLFETRYNCKLPKFVSPVPDPKAWPVDALTVSWEDLDMYAFIPVALLGKVISKLSDHLCRRVILITPGWANMPWFWDLVDLSSQIPICLSNHPDPFNGARHKDLTSLKLHAWLLEPRQLRSKGSLAQWQYKLRLLKDAQPEQSMRQSGPFLLDGVKQVRWTSGRHLSNK